MYINRFLLASVAVVVTLASPVPQTDGITATPIATSTSTPVETATSTQETIPTSGTSTITDPSDFIPIQVSLPQASFDVIIGPAKRQNFDLDHALALLNPKAGAADTVMTSALAATVDTESYETTTSAYDIANTPFYAACAESNFANYVNGSANMGTDLGSRPDDASIVFSYPGSAYECCVTTILNPNSAFWFYGFGICYTAVRNTCLEQQFEDPSHLYVQEGVLPRFTAGNGRCGQLVHTEAL